MGKLAVGMRVAVRDKGLTGAIRYIGHVDFAKGKWIGIHLDEPKGKNNGTVQGRQYFHCEQNYGMFVRQTQVEALEPAPDSPSTATPTATPTKPGTPKKSVALDPDLTTPRPPAPSKPASTLKRTKPSSSSSTTSAPTTPTTDGAAPDKHNSAAKSSSASKNAGSSSRGDESAPQQAATHPPSSSSASKDQPASQANKGTSSSSSSSSSSHRQEVQKETPAPVSHHSSTNPQQQQQAAAKQPLKTTIQKETDPIRVRELEKYKKQIEQLQAYKASWQEKQEQLVTQLNEFKQNATVNNQRYESEVAMLREKTQLALLDQEVAEEQNRDFQEQIQDLQDQIEELTLNNDILQAELADVREHGVKASTGSTDASQQEATKDAEKELNPNNTNNTAAVRALKSKIGRLTLALYKVREQYVAVQEESKGLKSELSEAISDNTALSKALQMKDIALQKATEEYKSQVDRADSHFSAETMVESLTDQNLALEERVHQLEEEVYHLRQETEVLEQTRAEYETQQHETITDLSEYDHSVQTLMQVVHSLVEKNREQADVISKYRKALREKEDTLVETTASMKENLQNTLAQQKKVEKLVTSAVSRRRDAVATEAHSLAEEQAAQHVEFLKSFLPQSFFRDHYNGFQLYMLLGRIARKASIISSNAAAEFCVGEDHAENREASDLTLDQSAFGSLIVNVTSVLGLLAQQIRTGLEHVETAQFKTIGESFAQLSVAEGVVDAIIERITGDGLDPSMDLDKLKDAVKSFQTVSNQVSNYAPATGRALTELYVTTALGSSEALEAELVRVGDLFTRTSATGTLDPSLSPLLAHINEMVQKLQEEKSACRKILRSLPAPVAEVALELDNDTQESLKSASENLYSAAVKLSTASRAFHAHVRGSVTNRALDYDTAMQIGVNCLVDLSASGELQKKAISEGADASTMPVHISKTVAISRDVFLPFATSIEAGAFDSAVENNNANTAATSTPPCWVTSAKAMRESVALNIDLPMKLEEKEAELLSLKKSIKLKERALKEKDDILLVAKRNTETVRNQCDQQLEEKEEGMKAERGQFEQKMAETEATLHQFQETYRDLQEKTDTLKKRLLAAEGLALGGRISSSGADATSAHLRSAELRIFLLQEALQYERLRGAKAQATATVHALSALRDITPTHALPKALRESGKAIKGAQEVTMATLSTVAGLKIVDITKPGDAEQRQQAAEDAHPTTAAGSKPPTTPMEQYTAAVTKLQGLYLKARRSRAKLQPIIAAATNQPPSIGLHADRTLAAAEKQARNQVSVGHITLPGKAAAAVARVNGTSRSKILLTPIDFQAIHRILAQ